MFVIHFKRVNIYFTELIFEEIVAITATSIIFHFPFPVVQVSTHNCKTDLINSKQ